MTSRKPKLGLLASSISLGLLACGGGGGQESPTTFAAAQQSSEQASAGRLDATATASAETATAIEADGVEHPRPSSMR